MQWGIERHAPRRGAIRVLTGLGEGAFYFSDRSLNAEKTPIEKRSLGLGVVITGLAFGITIATASRRT